MKKHRTVKKNSFRYALLLGLIISICSFLALALLSSGLVLCQVDPLKWIKPVFLFTFLLSAAISGYAGRRVVKGYGIYPTLVSSLIIVLCLFGAGLIVGGGKISLANLMSYLSYILVSLLFAFIGGREPKRRRARR